MNLKGSTGKSYSLESKPFNNGGEGDIFGIIGDKSKVVKIYHQDRITNELENKLLRMTNNPPNKQVLSQVAWPLDVVYDSQNVFCGFVMPRLNITAELGEIYVYPPRSNITYQQKLILAQNICVVIYEVHRAGYVFGDFNPRNIGVDINTGAVAFLDTDSYHIVINKENDEAYRCNVCAPGYAAPELLKKCSAHIVAHPEDSKQAYAKTPLDTFTQETDNFALAIHLFKLLMNGFTPFGGIKETETASVGSPGQGDVAVRRDSYCFKPGNKPLSAAVPPINSLPKEIADLFTMAFIKGRSDPKKRPSALEWHKALVKYESSLIRCSKNSAHMYYSKLRTCPWCEADARYEVATAPQIKQKAFTTPVVPMTLHGVPPAGNSGSGIANVGISGYTNTGSGGITLGTTNNQPSAAINPGHGSVGDVIKGALKGFFFAWLIGIILVWITSGGETQTSGADEALKTIATLYYIAMTIMGGVQGWHNYRFFKEKTGKIIMLLSALFIGASLLVLEIDSDSMEKTARELDTEAAAIEENVYINKYHFDDTVKLIGYCNGNEVNVRNRPNSDTGEIIEKIRTNGLVPIIVQNYNEKWDKVWIENQEEAYMFNKYINVLCSVDDAILTEAFIIDDQVDLYRTADLESDCLISLKKGTPIWLLTEENDWAAVLVEDSVGFIESGTFNAEPTIDRYKETSLTNKYIGSYTNSRGIVGLTFEILGEDGAGNLEAEFNFYPINYGADILSGSYKMKGTIIEKTSKNETIVSFEGTEWINQPDNDYIFLNFSVQIADDNLAVISDDYDIYAIDSDNTELLSRHREEIIKSYVGTYKAGQKEMKARLTIMDCKENGEIKARFDFHADDSQEEGSGSFYMQGCVVRTHLNGDTVIILKGSEWIDQPESYALIDFTATISDNATVLTSSDYDITLVAD